jgi:hypothetical protein
MTMPEDKLTIYSMYLVCITLVKGLIAGMKAKVLAEGTDIDPEHFLKEAEDEIDMEMALAEVKKAKNILNNTDNWLTSHPLEVCIIEFVN